MYYPVFTDHTMYRSGIGRFEGGLMVYGTGSSLYRFCTYDGNNGAVSL